MRVSRDKLYEEVWAEPMVVVAARYGLSSNFLGRVCERLNVPRPRRGYWAKAAVGRAPSRPALPGARPGDELEWIRGRAEPGSKALPAPPAPAEASAASTRRRRSGPHDLTAGAHDHFTSGRESEEGYLRPNKKNLVDLFVSRAALSRALSLASALFFALDDRGHRVVLSADREHRRWGDVDERAEPGIKRSFWKSWAPKRPTVVFVGTVAIGLTIVETSEHVEVGTDYSVETRGRLVRRSQLARQDAFIHLHDMPSGRLCLIARSADRRATWERRWPETKVHELRRRVDELVLELEREAPAIAKLVEEGERRAELRRQELEVLRQKWEREEAERRSKEALKASREQLLAIVDAWASPRGSRDSSRMSSGALAAWTTFSDRGSWSA